MILRLYHRKRRISGTREKRRWKVLSILTNLLVSSVGRERKVAGSNPDRTNTQGPLNN